MRKPTAITWEDIYQYWHIYAHQVPESLQIPVRVEEIYVDYKQEGVFYGYDWLSRKEYVHRKELIKEDITSFLWFTRPANKGTIHTLQMLLEANDDEERAAIWLFAFTKEIMDTAHGSALRFARQINDVCWSFLNDRFYMWHHAMKRLVPEIYISFQLLAESEYSSIYSIIDLARINAAFISYEYVPVCYSSLKSGEDAPDISVRRNETCRKLLP